MRLLAGGESVAGIGVIELAERDGFPGLRGSALFRALAKKLEDAGHAAGLTLGRDQRRAVADLPVEDARDRHLAAMRGVQRLHHIGDRHRCRS